MIKFVDVFKDYRGKLALNGVSFEIERGKVVGYIGPNGAGKTTTLKIIVGLIRDFKGEYSCLGYSMPENISLVQNSFGYLPQNVAFQEWRTIAHALRTFGILSGVKKDEIDERIEKYLSLFEVNEVQSKKISRLSGGTIQKIGIIQALLHNPDILVLDEPLNGLDPLSRMKLKEVFLSLKDEGKTIIFSSHILSDVEDVADDVIIINEGRILAQGNLEYLKEKTVKLRKLEIKFLEESIPEDIFSNINVIEKIERKSSNYFLLSANKSVDFPELSRELVERIYHNKLTLMSFYLIEPNLDEIYSNLLSEGEALEC